MKIFVNNQLNYKIRVMHAISISILFIFCCTASATFDSNIHSNLLNDLALTHLSDSPSDSNHSSWSEVVVVRMYYDCKGQLMQQKISTLRTRNDLKKEVIKNDIANEDELQPKDTIRKPSIIETKKIKSYLQALAIKLKQSKTLPKEENLSLKDQTSEEETKSQLAAKGQSFNLPTKKEDSGSEETSKPKVFRSMPGRFKQPNDPLATVEHQAVQFATGPKVEVNPDTIIDTPIIPCPGGMNEGRTGDCRPIFKGLK